MRGITKLYDKFKQQLRKDPQKFASLQLISRLEEYLSKEFCSIILRETEGRVLPLTNAGGREEKRKIDLALLQGNIAKALDKSSLDRRKLWITAFVEIKYLRNRHRFSFGDATDELAPTLGNLQLQLKAKLRETTYAGYTVKLRGRRKDVYGLVIVSHVRREHESHEGKGNDPLKSFLDTAKDRARDNKFRFYDLNYPKLECVYKDEKVAALRGDFRCSLFTGLWRLG